MDNAQIEVKDLLEGILPVDKLEYEQIDRRYRSVQLILTGMGYILLAALALFLLLLDERVWCILAECAIVATMSVNLLIVDKAWRFKGYALRESDITYRSGVVFPSATTVPYSRVQQVSVKQNPVSKLFRLYSVEIVNGAQGLASQTIPGLSEERANLIKSIVIDRMKNDQD
ncbi:MAG: PH domain-containing protein [Muribaculaceae bacterium]|nr:PH domain-containing protein [Muribaculaceae bacterium]